VFLILKFNALEHSPRLIEPKVRFGGQPGIAGPSVFQRRLCSRIPEPPS
jgi:hypothetical protein